MRLGILAPLFFAAGLWALAGEPVPIRALTFEERIAAAEAIERVYDARRLWPPGNGPRPPFEERVPRALLEAKVRDTLRRSAALETFWHRPVTTAQLQAEMDRMARSTRDPELLRELFRAVGDDPVLIAECLGRPVLTERLLRSWYAYDRRFHAEASSSAEAAARSLDRDTFESHPGGQLRRIVFETHIPGRDLDRETSEATGERRHVEVSPAELAELRSELGPADGSVRRREREDGIDLILVLRDEAALEVLTRTFPKERFSEWWDATRHDLAEEVPRLEGGLRLPVIVEGVRPASRAMACDSWSTPGGLSGPGPRTGHSAVWTGAEMIVWGGFGTDYLQTGARFDPATSTWTSTSVTAGCPSGRVEHTAVWTGNRMVIWGGRINSTMEGTGGQYDPVTDTWVATSAGPSARTGHTAIWTGREMIVWGGCDPSYVCDKVGGRYDPSTDAWTPTSTANPFCPQARRDHSAVWTGTRMIVWGGRNAFYLDDGGSYDPVNDRWGSVPSPGATAARARHTAVWTGSEMVLWGGFDATTAQITNTGDRYDPVLRVWTPTSTGPGCPEARELHTSVWTGAEMVVWGGALETGGRYDPATDTWSPTATGGACPTKRRQSTAVWTGVEMLVWGGRNIFGAVEDTGGRYAPATDSWAAITPGTRPAGRWLHTGIWTGAEMIVWGGVAPVGGVVGTGGAYEPGIDAWRVTSTGGACPSPRDSHTAVWSGSEMIVWGGRDALWAFQGTGGRYDPVADAWTSTAMGGASPSGRIGHSAIWTGTEMIVWSGFDGGSPMRPSTGGRYDPALDSWTATSTGAGCPLGRANHGAVWTGTEMVIWGGYRFGGEIDTGGRYTPSTDSWAATSTGAGCPSARERHTAVWTGTEMIVWGGTFGGGLFDQTGGRYAPALDRWVPTSTGTGCPGGRYYHTTVWTGTEMIVWGGLGAGGEESSGARYLPSTDTWTPTPTLESPAPRYGHAAAWTGTKMIVWGGYPITPTGGVYTIVCPVTAYLVGAGLGAPNPPNVRVFDGGGVATAVDFFAYGASQWGANVAATDLDGPTYDEILSGPGPGDVFGPQVRGWNRTGAALGKVSYYAYGTLRYGVNVAGANIDGDTYGEMVTGPGPGTVFGPHVRAFDFDATAVSAIAKVNFFAYGTLNYGANVGGGDVDGDGYAEIVTGPGPGPTFSPQVRGFDYDGSVLAAMGKLNYVALPFAGYGVNVAAGDVDFDGYAEIASAAGPGPSHPARFVGHGYDAASVAALPGFAVTAFRLTQYGARVGLGDVEVDGREDLLCGAGRDPSAGSAVKSYRYTAGQQLQQLPWTFTPFPALRYGVNVATGALGY